MNDENVKKQINWKKNEAMICRPNETMTIKYQQCTVIQDPNEESLHKLGRETVKEDYKEVSKGGRI